MLQLNEAIITLYDAPACCIAKSLQKKSRPKSGAAHYIYFKSEAYLVTGLFSGFHQCLGIIV